MKKLLFASLLILMISLPSAMAHPFLEETNPPRSSTAPVGVTEIITKYSEAVELDFSTVEVFDDTGNQIDNKDVRYYENEKSLIVSTPPLENGIYTVTSKVLSKVDGHLVNYAFVIGVGDVQLEEPSETDIDVFDIVFLPEAASRFPGFVGQTIVLGGMIASLMIWGTQNKTLIKNNFKKFQSIYHSKFLSLIGIGLIVVFASNILMLAVHTIRLQTSAFDALQTSFGETWIIRMTITVILLGLWFSMERTKTLSVKNQIPLVVLSLALIATTTMMGHGAASEIAPPVILDYIHNLVAAVWIGGIIFFAFTLLPSLSLLKNGIGEKLALAAIPRFSIVFVMMIGVVIISGPTLMWFLEDDVGMITESTYGKLIITKIILAAIMIGIGGHHQYKIQNPAIKNFQNDSIVVSKKLKNPLKVEAALGIALLGVVALLANGTLPAGEIQQAEAQQIIQEYNTIEFSENAKFDVKITPFTSGKNVISLTVADTIGKPFSDFDQLKVRVSNPLRNIAPIEIPMNQISENEFRGEVTFGFSGNWQIEIEAQRTKNQNESVFLNLLVKPRLDDLKVELIEYDFPEFAGPLYPVYDGEDTIWISDSTAPKLWKFSLDNQQLESFEFDGQISVSLTIDNDGKVWFTDTPAEKIGVFNPNTEEFQIISLPELQPLIAAPRPVFLEVDSDNNVWISVPTKNAILKYNQKTAEFKEFKLPTTDSGPFGLLYDPSGKMWFTQTLEGQIGYIDLKTDDIREIPSPESFSILETLTFDKHGNIWISEHDEGGGIVKFNPILETYEKIPVVDTTALPNDPTFDKFQNIWIALHVVDKFAVYNPDANNMIEIPIPTQTSFVQFMTVDDENNIWFAEQRGGKIGKIEITEIPSAGIVSIEEQGYEPKYAEIVSPLISLGIIATSLFFVKNVKDKRRINSLISS
ncbi:MAG TPA: CopD family protein [Nitrosopumilaceae archaeon]|nr:CopD family protein [Nitrosopumilaceae archaeon]